jgi:Bacterial proteasome activator
VAAWATPDRAPDRVVLPGKAVRVGSTARELLEELPPRLAAELARLAPSLPETPTEAELRIAEAQLLGWLDGLFHGTQIAMFAQRMAARSERLAGRAGEDGAVHQPDPYL